MDKKAAAELRQRLRDQRRNLPDALQLQHGQAVCNNLATLPAMRHSLHIGLYLPVDGELDLRPLRRWLLTTGRLAWLPVLMESGLYFRPWHWRMPMQRNRYDIAEPVAGPLVTVDQLDILILPLVACDQDGNRLGMGAGWYDRTLAAVYPSARCPWLVGAGHQFQQVDTIEPDPWDIPLDALVTEQGLTPFHRRTRTWPTG